MSELSIQQVLTSKYRTSQAADKITNTLMEALGLSTKANVARLAIGRSLGLGAFPGESVDSKGYEIPATSLFTKEDVAAWVGLIVTHAQIHGLSKIDTMDSFRSAVKQHWHRGTSLLLEDWENNDQNFERFLELLINRRAELPNSAIRPKKLDTDPARPTPPQDISSMLLKAINNDIGVAVEIKGVLHGPRVSRYKIYLKDVNQLDKLRNGIEKLSLVLNLQHAIPIMNHGDESKTVFLDIPRPNDTWDRIYFQKIDEWVHSFTSDRDKLNVFPGVDVVGTSFSFNLSEAPHLLVGGATGQGKSVCLHALIYSLIMGHTPESLQLALIDPKQVEFSVYSGSPFLYGGTVAVGISESRTRIEELIEEMDSRYESFNIAGVTNIIEARRKGIKLPYIVVFIEELADLVLQDRELENQIVRLAQLARAAGIHLVLATQRPDAKTFSGLIRSNIPARIALRVQKSSESKIILDEVGAENLLGAGDMLVKLSGTSPTRVHGVYISREDIAANLKRPG